MTKLLKKMYGLLSGVFFIRDAFASLSAGLGIIAVGELGSFLRDYYWFSWNLLIILMLFLFLFLERGVISIYPRPDFSSDFRTLSTCFRNFMSDSSFYSRISNVDRYEKIQNKTIDGIYKLSEQLSTNPIKLRSRRLRAKYQRFCAALEELIDFLEANYSVEGAWSVLDSRDLANKELKKLRFGCKKRLLSLSNNYSILFSEISHMGGTTFEVQDVYSL